MPSFPPRAQRRRWKLRASNKSFTKPPTFKLTKKYLVQLELNFEWVWGEDGGFGVGLRVQRVCVGGRPGGKRIYTGGRSIGIQFQDQGVMTPLLGRASGGGLRDWLPTPDSHQLLPQHTHKHSHMCMCSSSGAISGGLITSWDLGLWGQDGASHTFHSFTHFFTTEPHLLPPSLIRWWIFYFLLSVWGKPGNFSQKIRAASEREKLR